MEKLDIGSLIENSNKINGKKICGVYMIYCISNKKYYIGSSIHIKSRWTDHKWLLKNNDKTCSPYLQNAWNKYGAGAFLFIILERTDLPLEREQYWIDKLKSADRKFGFNIRPTATSSSIVSEETRAKMRNSHLGKKLTEEQKQKIRMSLIGKSLSEEHKKKISISHIGKMVTEETRNKMSIAFTGRRSARSSISDEKVKEIRIFIKENSNVTFHDIVFKYSLPKHVAKNVMSNKFWKDIVV